MNKRKLLFTLLALSLGCLTGGSRAMAQNGWDAIYSQTQTTSKSWTQLSESSTKGKVLGASGATTYYYVTGSLDFTNDKTTNDGAYTFSVKEPMPTVVRAQVLVLN